jgi:hypothetical protein
MFPDVLCWPPRVSRLASSLLLAAGARADVAVFRRSESIYSAKLTMIRASALCGSFAHGLSIAQHSVVSHFPASEFRI